MNISYVVRPFNSIGLEWIYVMTASAFAAILSVWSLAGLPRLPLWAVFAVFLFTLCLAFVRSWNREHTEVERLGKLLLREYELQVKALHKSNTVWDFAHERYLISQMDGDEVLIRQAIENVKLRDPSRNFGVA